ncbi:MAG: AsmA-like C-terminal domain-containing protein, partial [SAR324 cluster bacterium]|nr:AsmA-like C-terminal domain-containing protein [SAR324 cluster bacterium]
TGKVSFELNSEAMKINPSISLSGTLKGTLEDNGTFYAEHRGALFRDNQTLLNDANFTVLHSGNIPEVQGNGMIGENPLNFRFGSDTNGNGELDLEAENAGGVFRFLDLTEAISGGRLELISNFQGDNLSIHDSEIRLSNFTLKEAPLLVDVFSLISPTGLLEQLLGDGVFYDEGYGKVSVSGNRYTIHEASAVGFSSGIVFSGWIDLDKNELDIKGSVAPAYILSRLVRWIPILGTILTGTDKGGLIALDFRLQGSIDKPEKSTNPLSLAPGILRDVFRFEWLNFFRGDNSTKQVEQPPLNLNESSE